MSNLESRTPRSKLPAIVSILALLAGGYYLAPRFEREAPRITLAPDSDVLGRSPIEIGVTD
jgi:hypothetical protein